MKDVSSKRLSWQRLVFVLIASAALAFATTLRVFGANAPEATYRGSDASVGDQQRTQAVVTVDVFLDAMGGAGQDGQQQRAAQSNSRAHVSATARDTGSIAGCGSGSSSSSGGGGDGGRSSGGSSSGGQVAPIGPLSSSLACDSSQPPELLTPKEHDMQQQRRCALERAGGRPAGGYLALCLAVKNQHNELAEWLDYYRRMGVSRVYALEDPQSEPPLEPVLRPYVKDGFAVHRKMPAPEAAQAELANSTCHEYFILHKQLMAYAYCLKDYGANHQWMGFIDPDEYLVLTDDTPSLPALLRGYEAHGALAVSWRMFGSSGHLTRQKNTLRSYTKCNEEQAPENTHVKVFANMAHVGRISGPHDATHAPGYFTVNTSGQKVVGPTSAPADTSRAVLNHYILRSREEFREKMQRGSAMSKPKTWEYWNATEATMVATCQTGVQAWQRLYARRTKPGKHKAQRRQMVAP